MASDKTQKANGPSFKLIEPDLISLTRSIKTTIDQNKRNSLKAIHPELSPILIGVLRVAWETWQTIGFICSDKIEEKGGHLEFVVSVPPLTRTVVDSVFMLVYLFDSPANRLNDYFVSTWAKLKQDHNRFKKRYGNMESRKDWLNNHAKLVSRFEKYVSQKPKDEKELKKLSRQQWPNPGGMIGKVSNKERRDFLTYLNDWFYGELSQDSHLSGPGMIRRGGIFLDQSEQDKRIYRSNCVLDALTFLLALLSELVIDACDCDAELKKKAASLWRTLKPYWGPAEDFWTERYEKQLSSYPHSGNVIE